MITFLLGRPGGGKSYEAVVHHILPALQAGRRVVTNIPLSLQHFTAIEPSWADLIDVRHPTSRVLIPFTTLDCYKDEWKHPVSGVGVLFVIDECHIPLPSKGTPRPIEEWFSMHRHKGVDVLLISQSHGKIARNIIKMVETVLRVRKNIALGAPGSYTYEVRSDVGSRATVLNTQIRRYNRDYFKLYQSYTLGGEAEAASGAATIWSHWSFKLAAGLVVVAAAALIFNPPSLGGAPPVQAHKPVIKRAGPERNNPLSAAEARPSAPAQPVAASPIERIPQPLDDVSVRITGYIGGGSDEPTYHLILSNAATGRSVRTTSDALLSEGWIVAGEGRCLLHLQYRKQSLSARC